MLRVRPAHEDERAEVANVLDGAALEVDPARLESAITDGDALVAVEGEDVAGASIRILGALVLEDDEILAIAVRRRRRGQGIGTELIEAAAERCETLDAEFDAAVRPFWESLGFEIAPTDEDGADRYRGVR